MKKRINTNRIAIYLLTFLLISIFISNLSAQMKYIEIIDTAILNHAKFENLNKINTKYLEFSPTFYDGSIVYVSSEPFKKRKFDRNIGEAFFSLRQVTIDSTGNFTGSIDFSSGLIVKNHLGPCAFSNDENTIFISRNKKSVVKINNSEKDINPMGIYLYKYSNGYWINYDELPINSHKYKVFHPTWDEANNRLIFASDMPGGYGGTDLYSIKKVGGKWIELKNLGSLINSDKDEAFPFIYQSKYLFFASKRAGSRGGFDLYLSKEEDMFSIPTNLGDKFNTEYDDFGLILGEDSSIGYFTSSRPGGKGKDDIYRFSSDKSIFRLFNNYFTIKVTDITNNNLIENAKITFSKFELIPAKGPKISKVKGIEKEIIYTIDQTSLQESKPVYSNNLGENNIKLPSGSYIVKVSKPGYLPYSGIIYTERSNKLFRAEMSPEILDTFEITFYSSVNNTILDNVSVEMEGGDENNKVLRKGNAFLFLLSRGNTLHLKTSAEGYSSKELDIAHGNTPSRFDVILLKKKKYVEYLPTSEGEIMVLKDIYYKYNSDKLTNKAKTGLDKLAKHLKKYPNLIIELSSHTDSRGRKTYNKKLSERRSKNAKKYLESIGISGDRIKVKGYGETRLRNHCYDGIKCSEKEHAINRRTEVKVLRK